MPKIIDFTGQRVGRLTVLQFGEHRRTVSGTSKRYWLCKCDCGNTCLVESQCLSKGVTRSCGCLKIESDRTNKNHLRHGKSKTRLYKIWVDIKRRCDDSLRKAYKYYGGKGIIVCDEWSNNFEVFYEWAITNGYQEDAPRGEFTIDRINTNGNYEPNNCRFVDTKTQSRNKTSNLYLTYKGATKSLADWSDEVGILATTIESRIRKHGWSVEKALTTPVKNCGRRRKNG